MSKKKTIIKYCSGCGLCKSENKASLSVNNKGFLTPSSESINMEFCLNICPSAGQNLQSNKIWGSESDSIYYAWSSNSKIRKSASSGGVLSSLCIYLLENKLVDGIIQTTVSEDCVYGTKTIISRSASEVLKCSGSRYSISSPLSELSYLINPNEKYAFVGKPCDVAALRSYKDKYQQYDNIVYLFSFFCAGLPSNDAQNKLLNRLNTNNVKCKSLQYRGNGWPGSATAVNNDNTISTMSYSESWGGILGRDVNLLCRFCYDGIGISADISCGDAWYVNSDNTPDFTEKEGRNVVFLRTENGKVLFENCIKSGTISGIINTGSELKYIQNYQYKRRATMLSSIIALKLMGRPVPFYSFKLMLATAKHASIASHFKQFVGIIKRCIYKKI
ncbi:Coenzyme F420 hydrogenase/dehydrogenase, beta subunit C-terminal domain [Butyrivibrio sp. MC2013]|uniref:Coenzyme F420 hydrogenase/dehydrogenase, beta subunit C-terminal domain n=1 Tax=Butyrivibrio sp. MC2013 TaxID=1280686 RepID=UPI0003FC53B0|nr:Coenzyme F420 hydrogenase/dehydrogenase, beta subunit C-terminal domain [Butyrivibrio sp. MC2013]